MKCYFCHQKIPNKEIHHSESFGDLKIGDCPDCQNDLVTTTMVTEGDKLTSAHLYVQWGDERYRFLIHVRDNYFAIVHIKEDDREWIYTTEEIPDINFRNVLNKLPIYLTFL